MVENLVLKLYYRYAEKVEFTVKYVKLDINGNVVEETSETNYGVIGNTYKATIKTFEDYIFLEKDSRNKLSGEIKPGEKLELVVYYQYNKILSSSFHI